MTSHASVYTYPAKKKLTSDPQKSQILHNHGLICFDLAVSSVAINNKSNKRRSSGENKTNKLHFKQKLALESGLVVQDLFTHIHNLQVDLKI